MVWHLFWRAAIGRDFFIDASLPDTIRGRLTGAHRSDGRVLIDYLITPTEIHVVSEIGPGDTPARIARVIGNVVARRVRQVQAVRNPVFASRFDCRRVDSRPELRDLVRMLSWRPVCLGLRRSIVYHAHGGLRTALGLTPIRDFDPVPLLRLFGDDVRGSRSALRAWMGKRPDPKEVRHWELGLGLSGPDGETGPVRNGGGRRGLAAGLLAEVWPAGEEEALQLLGFWVAGRLGLSDLEAMRRSSNSAAARARALVACLAVDHGLCPAARVARFFGRAKATLCEQMGAARRRPEDRRLLAVDPALILAGVSAARGTKAV